MYWLVIISLSAQALPVVPTWVHPDERLADLSASVVTVAVTMPAQPNITLIGPPGPVGAAVLVKSGDPSTGPVLLTSEFLVRGAESILLRTPAGEWPSKVLRSNVHTGLALLDLPDDLRESMRARRLSDLSFIAPTGFTVAEGRLLKVAVHGRGKDHLEWYWRMIPSLPGGHAFFDAHGDVVGIFALQRADEPDYGFAVLGEPIAHFLGGPTVTKPRVEELPIRDLGSTGVPGR
jgi:hypothetical protein